MRSRWNSARFSPRIAWSTGPIRSTGLAVQPADLRRACEVEARGFLLHLREGFIESEGEPSAVSAAGGGVGAGAPCAHRQSRGARRHGRRFAVGVRAGQDSAARTGDRSPRSSA